MAVSLVLRVPSCLLLGALTHECLALLPILDEEAVVLIELMSLLGPPKKPWSEGAGCLSSECVFRRGPRNMECRAKEFSGQQAAKTPRKWLEPTL